MSKLDVVIQDKSEKVKSKKWAVWSWIVLGVASLLALLYAVWTRSTSGRKLARLEHDLDVAKEAEHLQEVETKLQDQQKTFNAADSQVTARLQLIEELKKDTDTGTKNYEEQRKIVQDIKSFDELNARVRFADDDE